VFVKINAKVDINAKKMQEFETRVEIKANVEKTKNKKKENEMKKVIAILCAVSVLLTGCNEGKKNLKVDKVKIIHGNSQTTFANQEFKKEVIISFLSPKISGLLGGKGNSHPVSGVEIKIEKCENADLTWETESLKSDKGGNIRLKVTAGKNLGDQYLKVIPIGYEKKAINIRFITGLKIEGAKQETPTGATLERPIKITIKDSDNKPMINVPVYFTLKQSPEKKIKAKVKKSLVITNQNGVAETQFKMGEKTGAYTINAEISSPKHNLHIRAIEIKELGIDIWSMKGLVITVLGGLAIFIYGMKLMSDGLQIVAGEKLKQILQFFAKNRFIAVIAGALVTGIIQSSSACTVMVVGFVNAGLLDLVQAIGIVFGANIGTTITAQMIAFKIKALALPAIMVGMVVMMTTKKDVVKGWGQTVFGFGLLFFGMGLMGGELKTMKSFPSFISFFEQFDCTPLAGSGIPLVSILGAVMIGTIMTVVIQSSSATIGITLALASSGLINFYTAVPLILGDNIGTTITAVLASINANKRAKQTAVAHVLFNVLGATYMILLLFVNYPGTDIPIFLYMIDSMTAGDVFAVVPENITRHIAMAHTFFNVFNVLLFLPFIGIIAKICNKVIPIHEDERVKIEHLEPNLLDTPSIALDQTIKSIRYMTKEAWRMVESSMNDIFMKKNIDDKLIDKLNKREEKVDELQENISEYLVQLTQRELGPSQAELIPLLMHCNNDAEKIADHTANIISLTKRLKKTSKPISESGIKELTDLWSILKNQSEHVISCLDNSDKSDINFALKDERKINQITKDLEKKHILRLKEGKCGVVAGIIFIEMLSEIEKIADCFSNIAERAPELQNHHLNMIHK